MLSNDRWSIDIRGGWTLGQTQGRLELRPPSAVAHVVVSDLPLSSARPLDLDDSAFARDSLLDAAKAGNRAVETPFRAEDGRVVALGGGYATEGFCMAAAHMWPGTVLLLTLFQADADPTVREQARALFLSVRRRAPEPRHSMLTRFFRRPR